LNDLKEAASASDVAAVVFFIFRSVFGLSAKKTKSPFCITKR